MTTNSLHHHHHKPTPTPPTTMTSSHRLSLTSFYSAYLRRAFTSAGLTQQLLPIDEETTISFWAPPPNTNTISSKPLVLIHGFGPRAIWQWRLQVRALHSKFTLYVPDLVFFGESMTKSSERSEVFQAVSVAKLLEKLGVKKYSVMGTSYGGFVSYHMARFYPDRVEKVIIASSAVNMSKKDNIELVKRAKVEKIDELMLPKSPSQLRTLMGLAMYRAPSILPDFLLNDVIRTLYSENVEEKKQLLMGLTLARDDTVQLSPLQQEVLILWGEHDNIFPVHKAKELKEQLGDKVRCEVIPKTSHVPQIEDPKQFNDIVTKFLLGSS